MNDNVKMIIREWVESIVIAVVLALIVRAFIIQAFKIPTGSMRPTLMENDRIFVNKFIYRFKEPQVGDVIVFRDPEDRKKDLVKRLIARGGDVVEISQSRIKLNGQVIDTPPISEFYYYNRGDVGKEGQEINVPKDSFYALGDNSASSKDSRYWGFVPRKNIIGKAIIIYWPPNRLKLIE
ncbi:MAG: signal peptidase I [Candidatus Omnitrophica bacterium CG07_land_8_20_14_0_80_42_15]|uniref:Signal peptidase I n=1 Tax=Candidatus Aquitaenariimonas noxiae TaxID=1974741 RepID=A0A2J0L2K1_9BACT|nr:MAG: signal peptidase I [Candidatus Omnitrophica bacterium CG07_land_8_20_14_0_80_42_15]